MNYSIYILIFVFLYVAQPIYGQKRFEPKKPYVQLHIVFDEGFENDEHVIISGPDMYASDSVYYDEHLKRPQGTHDYSIYTLQFPTNVIRRVIINIPKRNTKLEQSFYLERDFIITLDARWGAIMPIFADHPMTTE